MAAIRAYAQKKSTTTTSNELTENSPKLYAYMTHLRQNLAITMRFSSKKHSSNMIQTGWLTPFLVFDSIDESNQSRRLQQPVVAATKNLHQNSSALFSNSMTSGGGHASTYREMMGAASTAGQLAGAPRSSLSAASMSMRQNLTQSNPTLQQLREANDDLMMPTPESQLSYKEMPPNAPPLPPNLKSTLVRSGTGKANQ